MSDTMSASKRRYEEALDKIPARPSRGPKTAPCTDAICQLFDATVIPDMMETGDSTEDSPRYRTVYYIGHRRELGAGLLGGPLTTCFDSIDDLEDFCSRNWEKFHLAAQAIDENCDAETYDLIITWR